MLIEHEHQHNETMLQTLALAQPGVYTPPRRRSLPTAPAPAGPETIPIEPGPFAMGDPGEGFAYDNERPRHARELPAFRIDRTAVTNCAFRAFVDDGGYAHHELWSARGWRWRCAEGVQRPLYWTDDGRERRFERLGPIDDALPVMHVSWHEADAFARWRGARLPTEAEWEKAATFDPATGAALPQPWGAGAPSPERANVDQLAFGPAPAGALAEGASPCGALGLIGDCWEWTAGELDGYPGFAPYPYREYSQVFFGGDYRVLRGASWATRPSVARPTFRNWDLPQRRQIFVGFRCALDGAG
jgi:iron(II)-dependent oxidoreductase